MSEARHAHPHHMSLHIDYTNMMASHQHINEQQKMAEYAQLAGGTSSMPFMRDMRDTADMQHAYGAGMLMNFRDRRLQDHAGVHFIAAQPPCLPFSGMRASSYGGGGGGGGVTGGGMDGGGGYGRNSMLHDAVPQAASSSNSLLRDAVPQASKHNKYCHFCQHVKVRVCSM
jgi:hypothetical protein